jgi:hypothetical protein
MFYILFTYITLFQPWTGSSSGALALFHTRGAFKIEQPKAQICFTHDILLQIPITYTHLNCLKVFLDTYIGENVYFFLTQQQCM